ncbi:hypothetical protein [Ancylobacter terrae]|uniref:hypothetical protein n=1 Tax=Ancylobacter sp. sgz301288 TaxID=3342077 RepID=UPI00385D7737
MNGPGADGTESAEGRATDAHAGDGWSGGLSAGGTAPVAAFFRGLRWTRAFRIFGAFLLAAIVGVTLLPGAALVSSMILGADPMFSAFYLLGIIFGMGYVIGIVLSFLPMLAWVVVSEGFRLRAPWWHIVAGGGIGAVAWMVVAEPGDTTFARVGLDTAIAGLAAGAIYWLIAGRTAGDWRRAAPGAPVPLPAVPPGIA